MISNPHLLAYFLISLSSNRKYGKKGNQEANSSSLRTVALVRGVSIWGTFPAWLQEAWQRSGSVWSSACLCLAVHSRHEESLYFHRLLPKNRGRLFTCKLPLANCSMGKNTANECSNYCTAALISHTSKVMLKILQTRIQQYVNREFLDLQAGCRKGRGTRDQIVNIRWIIEKQENSRKTSTSASLTMLKLLTVWVTTNCGKFLKRWEYQTTWQGSWEICMQVKKQQLELDMDQQTGSK